MYYGWLKEGRVMWWTNFRYIVYIYDIVKNKVHFLIFIDFSELNPQNHQILYVCLVSTSALECWSSKHITVTHHSDTLL